jgi:hypothetical protein
MKIPALISVVALTCGTAFAAGNYGSMTHNDSTAATHQSTANAQDNQSGTKGEGLGAKTKNAFHRLGQKLRNAGHRLAHPKSGQQTASNDTRSMGASGSNAQDSARQKRMDQAYADYQHKQQK